MKRGATKATRAVAAVGFLLAGLVGAAPTRAIAQVPPATHDPHASGAGTDAPEHTEGTPSRAASSNAPPTSPAVAARVRAALAHYRHEPSVADVVRAAQVAMPESSTASMASRARAAGWIPTVGLSARRGVGIDLTSPTSTAADDGLRLSTDDELSFTASLTFELDRLLFRREEIGIVREARADRAGRTDRIREIVRLYFLRRRLQLERDLGAGDPAAQALGIAEAEALLDAFTNGAFGRMLRSAARRR
jgi:hypothetical protein